MEQIAVHGVFQYLRRRLFCKVDDVRVAKRNIPKLQPHLNNGPLRRLILHSRVVGRGQRDIEEPRKTDRTEGKDGFRLFQIGVIRRAGIG